MGKFSRQKGLRFERSIVNLLREHGLDAYRIPLSGASNGFKSDVQIRLPAGELRLEAKSRGSGFKFLYDNLDQSDALVVKEDRGEALIILRLTDACRILGSQALHISDINIGPYRMEHISAAQDLVAKFNMTAPPQAHSVYVHCERDDTKPDGFKYTICVSVNPGFKGKLDIPATQGAFPVVQVPWPKGL